MITTTPSSAYERRRPAPPRAPPAGRRPDQRSRGARTTAAACTDGDCGPHAQPLEPRPSAPPIDPLDEHARRARRRSAPATTAGAGLAGEDAVDASGPWFIAAADRRARQADRVVAEALDVAQHQVEADRRAGGRSRSRRPRVEAAHHHADRHGSRRPATGNSAASDSDDRQLRAQAQAAERSRQPRLALRLARRQRRPVRAADSRRGPVGLITTPPRSRARRDADLGVRQRHPRRLSAISPAPGRSSCSRSSAVLDCLGLHQQAVDVPGRGRTPRCGPRP